MQIQSGLGPREWPLRRDMSALVAYEEMELLKRHVIQFQPRVHLTNRGHGLGRLVVLVAEKDLRLCTLSQQEGNRPVPSMLTPNNIFLSQTGHPFLAADSLRLWPDEVVRQPSIRSKTSSPPTSVAGQRGRRGGPFVVFHFDDTMS
jgi:hypothetical protein